MDYQGRRGDIFESIAGVVCKAGVHQPFVGYVVVSEFTPLTVRTKQPMFVLVVELWQKGVDTDELLKSIETNFAMNCSEKLLLVTEVVIY